MIQRQFNLNRATCQRKLNKSIFMDNLRNSSIIYSSCPDRICTLVENSKRTPLGILLNRQLESDTGHEGSRC